MFGCVRFVVLLSLSHSIYLYIVSNVDLDLDGFELRENCIDVIIHVNICGKYTRDPTSGSLGLKMYEKNSHETEFGINKRESIYIS